MSIIETNKPIKKTRSEARFIAKRHVKVIDPETGLSRMIVDDLEIGSGSNPAGRGNRRHASSSRRLKGKQKTREATKLSRAGDTELVDLDVMYASKDAKSFGRRHMMEVREKPALTMAAVVATA